MEFKRSQLKKNAKATLKNCYWKSFLAVLIVGLLAGAISLGFLPTMISTVKLYEDKTQSSTVGSAEDFAEFDDINTVPDVSSTGGSDEAVQVTKTITVLPTSSTLSTLYGLLVVNILTVGLAFFFIQCRKSNYELGNIFRGFSKNYGTNVLTMFLVGLFIFLWTLLFIIPGFIKSYQYSMVPYVLADNPDCSYKEAFAMSKKLTKGYKWKLFVLDISFIGWYILCMCTCGIGFIFLDPYIESTKAEAYERLKEINGVTAE